MRCGLFDDGAAWCEVALEHGDTALWINWIARGFNDVLFKAWACSVDLFAQGAACDRHCIKMQ